MILAPRRIRLSTRLTILALSGPIISLPDRVTTAVAGAISVWLISVNIEATSVRRMQGTARVAVAGFCPKTQLGISSGNRCGTACRAGWGRSRRRGSCGAVPLRWRGDARRRRETTFSSIMMLPTSLPPKRRPIWQVFRPWRHPGRLHVLEVVQVDARDGQRLQVFHRRGFFLDEVAERSVLALEGPGDEGREAAGLFLQIGGRSSRWFMRCSRVSPQPNIMVAVVRMPSWCAVRCTSIHSCVVHFRRLMRWRTSSSRISAPPPGMESRPASLRRAMVSRRLRPLTSAMFMISGAEKQCR